MSHVRLVHFFVKLKQCAAWPGLAHSSLAPINTTVFPTLLYIGLERSHVNNI